MLPCLMRCSTEELREKHGGVLLPLLVILAVAVLLVILVLAQRDTRDL